MKQTNRHCLRCLLTTLLLVLMTTLLCTGCVMPPEYQDDPTAVKNCLMEDSTENLYAFTTNIYKDRIISITFLDSLSAAPKDTWDVSRDQDGSVLAWASYNIQFSSDSIACYDLYIGADGGVTAPESCRGLFGSSYDEGGPGYHMLRSFDFGNAFHTSHVTDMAGMFASCVNLREFHSHQLDTSRVTDMYGMFYFCMGLEELDLTGFDTSNVTNMRAMFNNCYSLRKLDISSFDTSNVTNMSAMFSSCAELPKLDLTGFDTGKVESMEHMFSHCYMLEELNVSSFDTSRVTNMRQMFSNNRLETVDLSSFVISENTDTDCMFENCAAGDAWQHLLSSGKNAVTDIRFTRIVEADGEKAIILGKNRLGEVMWKYTTKTYPRSYDSVTSEIAHAGNRYYYCEGGALVALDANTGRVLWKNDDLTEGTPRGYVDDNGNIYLSEYGGLCFLAVDPNGKTLHTIEGFDVHYAMPYRIRKVGSKIGVYMAIGPEGRYQGLNIFLVDPEDFSYRLRHITSEEASQGVAAPSGGGEVAEILFDRIHDYDNDGEEYAVITGYDQDGNVIWRRKTGRYSLGNQYDMLTEIACADDRYYYAEAGSVVALDVNTGEVLWLNAFGGISPKGFVDDDGTLYLCGYLGPAYCAINSNGRTVGKIEDFGEDISWACHIYKTGDKIAVYNEFNSTEDSYKPVVCLVDPDTLTYEVQE